MKLLNSLPTQIGAASVLFVLCLIIPMTTSLAQGIHERKLLSWQGVEHLKTGQISLVIKYEGDPNLDLPLTSVPKSWFSLSLSSDTAGTTIDSPAILGWLYKQNPGMVEGILGTNGNIASITNIFPHYPVAYTVSFLKQLAKEHINPDQFGGPDVKPGSVPYQQLSDGLLHVDTLADNNTLVQCSPNAIPQELIAISHKNAVDGGVSG